MDFEVLGISKRGALALFGLSACGAVAGDGEDRDHLGRLCGCRWVWRLVASGSAEVLEPHQTDEMNPGVSAINDAWRRFLPAAQRCPNGHVLRLFQGAHKPSAFARSVSNLRSLEARLRTPFPARAVPRRTRRSPNQECFPSSRQVADRRHVRHYGIGASVGASAILILGLVDLVDPAGSAHEQPRGREPPGHEIGQSRCRRTTGERPPTKALADHRRAASPAAEPGRRYRLALHPSRVTAPSAP
jgi:hypothetical protein